MEPHRVASRGPQVANSKLPAAYLGSSLGFVIEQTNAYESLVEKEVSIPYITLH